MYKLPTDDHPSVFAPALTTHDLVIALLNAVAGLSERLTGEQMNICIDDGRGNYRHIGLNSVRVWFQSADQEEVVSRLAGHSELVSKHCPLHGGPDDSPRSLGQEVPQKATV